MKPGIQNNSKVKRGLIISLIFCVSLIGITYVSIKIWFKSEIKQISNYAMVHYPGDKIEALISLSQDKTQELKIRNNAIWALGKIRDTRSIPALKGLQTGKPCDHTGLVCQRELEKAILTLEGKQIDLFTYK